MIWKNYGPKTLIALTQLLKKSLMQRILLILILVFNTNVSLSDTKETYKQLSIFNEVYNRVKNQYVEEVTDKELIEKALNGMLQALDPHSSFMSEEI